ATISVADLLPLWNAEAAPDEIWVVRGSAVMFHVPDVAIFRIEDGCSIAVSPFPESDPDKIRLYVLGTCMGVLLLQRGILPLHGSAVAIDGKAYAIVGHSGAGKSTLASVLLDRGCRLLSDDVIPVILNEDHMPIVLSSYPQQKLWQNSIDELGIHHTDCKPLFDRELKFAVPVRSGF
ncbi:aldolase, partial [Paenibacillus sepulcri]|nr:aldolase [Paenibacillus sepulcri]